MAKRPPPGKCVHCLQHFDELTWDHVFPKAWYPDTTPPNLEKWKIPACSRCNSDYGRLEGDLLLRLGLSVDPADRESLGISDRALRATSPRYAKNERDKERRAAKRESILNQLNASDSMPVEGVLPNFGPQSNLHYETYRTIRIPKGSLEKLGEKIVRGLTYLVEDALIDDRYRISVHFIEDNKAHEVLQMIEAHGMIHDRGPGIVVKRAKAIEGNVASLWLIEIWGKLKIYAVVLPTQDGQKSVT